MPSATNSAAHRDADRSAAWLAGLSPIAAPPSHHTSHAESAAAADRQAGSPSPRRYGGNYPRRQDARRSQPWVTAAAALDPHLVRSRSPPLRSPVAHTTEADSGSVPSRHAPTAPALASSDGFAEVLARRWPFSPSLSESPAFTAAVELGRASELALYVNDGFHEMAEHLSREAGAVALEAARYRQAALYSTLQCDEAAKALAQAEEELADARRRLNSVRRGSQPQSSSAVAKRPTERLPLASGAAAEQEKEASAAVPVVFSVEAVTLRLDEELSRMREQTQQYEELCSRKTQLERQLAEWTAKEERLKAKLERVESRRTRELELAVAQSRSWLQRSTGKERRADGCTVRDLEVCLRERAGLLRHLQEGSAARLAGLRKVLGGSTPRKPSAAGQETDTPSPPHSTTDAERGVVDDSEEDEALRETRTARAAASASAAVLGELAAAHEMISLGEEEVVAEMTHLHLLFERCLRRDEERSASLLLPH